MTTCVYHDGILAADRRATTPLKTPHICPKCNHENAKLSRDNASKISTFSNAYFRKEKIIAVAYSGQYDDCKKFLKAFMSPIGFEDTMQACDFVGTIDDVNIAYIVVTTNSVYDIDIAKGEVSINRHELTDTVAIGSGRYAALLAIKQMGATADGAISFASSVDQATGSSHNYVLTTIAESDRPKVHTVNAGDGAVVARMCGKYLVRKISELDEKDIVTLLRQSGRLPKTTRKPRTPKGPK